MTPRLWFVCLVGVLVGSVDHRRSSAQDRLDTVWLEPVRNEVSERSWYPREITTVRGKIVRFDSAALRMTVAGEQAESAFDARRVLWVQAGEMSEREVALISLFHRRQPLHPLSELAAAMDEKIPKWRKKWLVVRAAHSMWHVSRDPQALSLCPPDPPPLLLAWFPIAWTRGEVGQKTPAALGTAVAPETPEQRLVWTSWQLRTSSRAKAAAMIEPLMADESSAYVRMLAETLQWRLATPPQVVQNADRWQSKVDAMPMVLQVGPTLTLIEKFEAAGLTDRAERLKLSLQLTRPFPHPERPQP